MTFLEKVSWTIKKRNSSLCIGLDPEGDKIPAICKSSLEPYFEFNKRIIDATHDCVSFYKPQVAHYSAVRKEHELEKTIAYIKSRYPEIIVILDSKRGDIGNTALYYAQEAFERYQADAVTVNPYMGYDSVKPFVEYSDKGVFVLCKTSNPHSADIQNIKDNNGEYVYSVVAKKCEEEWNELKNIGLVVGATYTKEMSYIRQSSGPQIPFLIPGIGAQGGDLAAVIKASYSGYGSIIINSSRGIIYADSSEKFDEVVRIEAKKLSDQINEYITHLN